MCVAGHLDCFSAIPNVHVCVYDCINMLLLVAQLLETSGVADVEPLASMLTSSGFKLAGVVTVVDAEAGSSQLQHEEVALAQVGWMEVVLLQRAFTMHSATISGPCSQPLVTHHYNQGFKGCPAERSLLGCNPPHFLAAHAWLLSNIIQIVRHDFRPILVLFGCFITWI